MAGPPTPSGGGSPGAATPAAGETPVSNKKSSGKAKPATIFDMVVKALVRERNPIIPYMGRPPASNTKHPCTPPPHATDAAADVADAFAA